MRRFAGVGLLAAGGALVVVVANASAGYLPPPGGGGGGSGPPAATIDAHGNAFTDNLGFSPTHVHVAVGQTVQWRNTDFVAPHTVTEVHGLFDLAGTYPPVHPGFPQGFGPGETRDLAPEGGTFHYYCRVHGAQAMHGVISVPDTVTRARRGVKVTWGGNPPPAGQVFDVERRAHGKWQMVRRGTTKLAGRFQGGGARFRSRVRKAGDAGARSGWSPSARLG
jgi:plastocyanin